MLPDEYPKRSLVPTVLVVEDEKRMRELLADVLPGMGFEPIAASTAEKALNIMETLPADIILLDLNLPVMDGLAFLDRLRPEFPDTPVIIMTGFGSLDAAQKAIRHNVSDFLSKPAHLGEIENALARAKLLLESRNLSDVSTAVAESDHPQTIAEVERKMILEALERNGDNRTAAANELGISRRTLYNRLEEYRIQDRIKEK